MRTNYRGTVGSSYTSLPWGDGYTATVNNSGGDQDNEHFAGLEHDAESGTEHAQFRNYASTQGRWLAPDSYLGSYDFTNPQSFNRYALGGAFVNYAALEPIASEVAAPFSLQIKQPLLEFCQRYERMARLGCDKFEQRLQKLSEPGTHLVLVVPIVTSQGPCLPCPECGELIHLATVRLAPFGCPHCNALIAPKRPYLIILQVLSILLTFLLVSWLKLTLFESIFEPLYAYSFTVAIVGLIVAKIVWPPTLVPAQRRRRNRSA